MKALYARHGNTLVAIDDAAERIQRRYGDGELVLIEHKVNRSAGNHRRFFRFRDVTFDMQEEYTDKEIWRKVLEMNAGHFDIVIVDGEAQFWPRSIAWDKLDDEHEFQRLFNRVVNGFLQKYGRGLTREQVDRVVHF